MKSRYHVIRVFWKDLWSRQTFTDISTVHGPSCCRFTKLMLRPPLVVV